MQEAQQYFAYKKVEQLEQEINLHVKITAKAYEKFWNVMHFRCMWSSKKVRYWMVSLYLCVCVCVCVFVSLAMQVH